MYVMCTRQTTENAKLTLNWRTRDAFSLFYTTSWRSTFGSTASTAIASLILLDAPSAARLVNSPSCRRTPTLSVSHLRAFKSRVAHIYRFFLPLWCLTIPLGAPAVEDAMAAARRDRDG